MNALSFVIAALIGLASGVTSGLFGVGGGVIMVPAMMFFLSPPVRDIKQAIGTSLVVIIPTALIGALRHHDPNPKLSNIQWPVALALIPTAMIGGYLGAWLTRIVHVDDLKRAFGVLLVVVGAKLIFFK